VGYSFLYISGVARPGDQIDRAINPNQAPAITVANPPPLNGPSRPAFPAADSDFWAHGVNLGVRLRF